MHKTVKRAITDATKRGWRFDNATGRHPKLRLLHHRVTVSRTPVRENHVKHLRRRLRKCEDGTCEHGAPPAPIKE